MASTISSESWRIRTSEIPEIELAQSLTALRKCVGSISPNTEHITFGNGSANFNGEQIKIDTEFAAKAGVFPIPPENFDILVGLAVHEAAHTSVKSARIPKPLPNPTVIFSERDFQETAEEVYTDQYVARHFPVQYKYLRKARDAYNKPIVMDWGKPALVWITSAIYGNPRDYTQIPKWQHAIHTLLDALVTDLSKTDRTSGARDQLYKTYWEVILSLLIVEQTKADLGKLTLDPIQLPKDLSKEFTAGPKELGISTEDIDSPEPSQVEGQQDSDQDTEESTGKQNTKQPQEPFDNTENTPQEPIPSGRQFPEASEANLTGLPTHIQQAVEQAMESATEDLSKEVSQALLESGASGLRLGKMFSVYSYSTSKVPAPKPSPKITSDLEWVSRIKNTIRTQTIRGELEGILDRRRLYRHFTDGRPYKIHRTTPRQDLDLVLLVDGSSSMAGDPEFIYETCYALLKVIPEAHMLVYYSDTHNCNVVNYNHSKQPKKVEVQGGTPTGRAMIMAALKYPRSLMIHFSDGKFNRDIDPKQAMERVIASRWPNIQVANIILRERHSIYSDRKQINDWPARGINYTTEFIGELRDFPEALRKALKPWYQV